MKYVRLGRGSKWHIVRTFIGDVDGKHTECGRDVENVTGRTEGAIAPSNVCAWCQKTYDSYARRHAAALANAAEAQELIEREGEPMTGDPTDPYGTQRR